jgi:hypothetical protein
MTALAHIFILLLVRYRPNAARIIIAEAAGRLAATSTLDPKQPFIVRAA